MAFIHTQEGGLYWSFSRRANYDKLNIGRKSASLFQTDKLLESRLLIKKPVSWEMGSLLLFGYRNAAPRVYSTLRGGRSDPEGGTVAALVEARLPARVSPLSLKR